MADDYGYTRPFDRPLAEKNRLARANSKPQLIEQLPPIKTDATNRLPKLKATTEGAEAEESFPVWESNVKNQQQVIEIRKQNVAVVTNNFPLHSNLPLEPSPRPQPALEHEPPRDSNSLQTAKPDLKKGVDSVDFGKFEKPRSANRRSRNKVDEASNVGKNQKNSHSKPAEKEKNINSIKKDSHTYKIPQNYVIAFGVYVVLSCMALIVCFVVFSILISQLKGEIDELKQNSTTDPGLEEKLDNLTKTVDVLSAKVTTLEAKVEKNTNDIISINTEVDQLSTRVKTVENKTDDNTQDIYILNTKRGITESEVDSLESQVQQLSSKLDGVEDLVNTHHP